MPTGFEEFAAAETRRLLGLARVLCGNDHDAWDLTQETLARVSARWDHLDHHDHMAAYARTAMANLHRNSRRRRREVLVADPPEHRSEAASASDGLDAWLDVAMRSLPRRQQVPADDTDAVASRASPPAERRPRRGARHPPPRHPYHPQPAPK